MVEVEESTGRGAAGRDAVKTGWAEGRTAKRRGGADRAASVSTLTGTYFVPAAFNSSICWRVASSSWRKASDMTTC